MLEARGITKKFPTKDGSVLALDGIDLDVPAGELMTILGPSGCGKSTFLYILAGLADYTSGSVKVAGKEVSGPGPDRGMVFQAYSLFPWLTVRENVRFSYQLKVHQIWDRSLGQILQIRSYADYLIELVGLQDFADRYPNELSGGMKQRAAIVRTLAARPKVLLMDEPFGALDAQTREEMQDLLLLLRKVEELTILFVTHDVDEAIYLGERICVFTPRPGRIRDIVPTAYPAERDQSLKLDPDFIQQKRLLIDLLHKDDRSDGSNEKRLDLLERLAGVAKIK